MGTHGQEQKPGWSSRMTALIGATALTFSLGIPKTNQQNYVSSNEPKKEVKKEKEYIRNNSFYYFLPQPLTPAFTSWLTHKYNLDLTKKSDLATFKLMTYLLPGGHREVFRDWDDEE